MDKEKFDLENFPTSDSARKMLSYVSDGFYDKSYVGKWIYQVMGIEYDNILEMVGDLPEQFFPETATWGLMYHEIKWGLPVRFNLSDEERRSLIYQKRDCRAPMTPYRMEKYLENVTTFEVHIADVNDLGVYGFVPSHPNVFKAYFLGKDTLNSKLVHAILNKLKQSHTIYTVNDRIEIQINNMHLERIRLYSICYILVQFWSNDEQNFKRSYKTNIIFTNWMHLYTRQQLNCINIEIKTQFQNENMIKTAVKNCYRISFWRCALYDGTWQYDGTLHYDAKRHYKVHVVVVDQIKVYTIHTLRYQYNTWHVHICGKEQVKIEGIKNFRYRIREPISEKRSKIFIHLEVAFPGEKIDNISVETSRHVAYYDGTLRYDGTAKYDALYRKEEVE